MSCQYLNQPGTLVKVRQATTIENADGSDVKFVETEAWGPFKIAGSDKILLP